MKSKYSCFCDFRKLIRLCISGKMCVCIKYCEISW